MTPRFLPSICWTLACTAIALHPLELPAAEFATVLPGVVRSASNAEVRSQALGTQVVLFAVPEGANVKQGELLARLDPASLENERRLSTIQLQRAEAELTLAKTTAESLRQRKQGFAELEEMNDKAAALARDAVLGKGGQLDIATQAAESETKVLSARKQAVQAKIRRWTKSGQDVPAEVELELLEVEERLQVAKRQRDFVAKLQRDQETAALAVQQKRQQLELQEQSHDIAIDLAEAEARVESSKLAIEQQRAALARLKGEATKFTITAPQAGTVFYANSAAGRSVSASGLQEGSTVRQGQTLMMVSDLTKLQVLALVEAADLPQLRPGQLAEIRFTALPDNPTSGVVTYVSPSAEPLAARGQRRYRVLIALKDPPEFARVGMAVKVGIETKTKALSEP